FAGQAELDGVLDGDNALATGDGGRQRVEESRLPGAGATRDEDVETSAHRPGEQSGDGRWAELVERDGASAEAPDGHARPVDGEGRHHGVDPRPVGKPCVDER